MSTEFTVTDWRVIWEDGTVDDFSDEADALEWIARFPGESHALWVRQRREITDDWSVAR